MNTITTSGIPQNITKVSKLFAPRVTINEKQTEHWNSSKIDVPLHWRKPRLAQITIDLFHKNVPDEWIDQVFAVIALCPQHTFQILTKRAERMRQWADNTPIEWPLEQVWLGVSVEDQKRWDERWYHLARTPAAIRFVSAEPLLRPIDMIGSGKLDWVICGGESGPNARPMNPQWARDLRDQCVTAGVPFFFKQWGEWAPAIFHADQSEEYYDGPTLHVDFDNCGDVDDSEGETSKYEARIWLPKGGLTKYWTDLPVECLDGRKIHACRKVGTKAAGNLLDGRVWDQMPEVTE